MKKYSWMTVLAFLAVACEEGIDPITPVAPGADATPPAVTIKYPGEGTLIRVREDVAPVKIEFDVADDIEIGSIAIKLDGVKITEYTQFKDYRHVVDIYVYDNLINGSHTLTLEATDLSGKSASVSSRFEKVEPYDPVYGEIFYMPFDGDYLELVSIVEATKNGVPAFAAGKTGQAYSGAPDAYLTFKTADLAATLGSEFSAAFRYKLDASPDRSGILVISPDDEGKSVDLKNNRTSGFRLFREGSATSQTVKLNVGDGTADSWFDGGEKASIDPAVGWAHIAFTVSPTECVVYINGEIVSQGASPGISWAGCDLISIASGAPRFTEWSHKSDNSLYDELRLFNRVLTQEEIHTLMNAK
jgi:hypothetical protein